MDTNYHINLMRRVQWARVTKAPLTLTEDEVLYLLYAATDRCWRHADAAFWPSVSLDLYRRNTSIGYFMLPPEDWGFYKFNPETKEWVITDAGRNRPDHNDFQLCIGTI